MRLNPMRSLSSWQIPFLGLRHFPANLTLFEIRTFFSFSEEERTAIRSRRGDHLRLAFGIHVGFLKMTGTTLSALDRIPIFVLSQVAEELDLPHINIATVRSLYHRRKRTLYEHQEWAMHLLSIEAFNERRQRAVMRAFRSRVSNVSDTKPMTTEIMSWLFTRGIRIPGPRRVRVIALKVARRAEHHLATLAIEAIPEGVREFWYEELFSAYGNSDSRLEWLGLPPYKRTTGALNEVVDKLVFLRILSVPMFATTA